MPEVSPRNLVNNPQTLLFSKGSRQARNAALSQAYEKAFSGVAKGSGEAFMDVFAEQFRKAYGELSQRGRRAVGRASPGGKGPAATF